MADRYSLNDRYPAGSCEERMNPKIANPQLNAKLGPRFPVTREPGAERRKRLTGLPSRLGGKGQGNGSY